MTRWRSPPGVLAVFSFVLLVLACRGRVLVGREEQVVSKPMVFADAGSDADRSDGSGNDNGDNMDEQMSGEQGMGDPQGDN